jgi:uncharacterized protein
MFYSYYLWAFALCASHLLLSQSMYLKVFSTLLFYLLLSNTLYAQSSYEDSIKTYWTQYKADLLSDPRKPIQEADLQYLQFYNTDSKYKVLAQFTRIVDTIGFDMPTQSGKLKKHFIYGTLRFKLNKKWHKLLIYQSAQLMNKEGFEDYLFLPFYDYTNNETTYGGGRYLDFKLNDIQNGNLLIDFNKAYNPYCAFATGFNCPIPPVENRLKIYIKAGEKSFGKSHE